jgi:hypothetical protein
VSLRGGRFLSAEAVSSRAGDCSPALAAGASVTAFGGSQRHNNLGFSMDFVKATFRWNVPLAIFSDSGKIAQRYRKIGLIQVK